MKNIFITGGTGFLGSYLLNRLLADKDNYIIVLARGKAGESPGERIKKTLKYLYGESEYKTMLDRVRIVEGEVDRPGLGLDKDTRKALVKDIDEIYHSAAIAEFKIPLNTIRKVNVKGARNVFEFALECRDGGRFKKVNHISTTYVCGTRRGTFFEDELDAGQKFNNTYEQSKFEAEALAQDYRKKGLEITIFRPSILTGDSVIGKTSNFKMLYQPLHFLAAELFDVIPADRNVRFNLMPVDYAAEAICLIADDKGTCNGTLHISNLTTVTAGHFIDAASDFFGFKKPEFMPLENFDLRRLTAVQRSLIDPYIPYFNSTVLFDATNAKDILEKRGFSYPVVDDELLVKLFKFCAQSGFIKRRRQHVVAG